jgi:hypothetical protein
MTATIRAASAEMAEMQLWFVAGNISLFGR